MARRARFGLAEVARNYIDARAYQERLDITRQNIAVSRLSWI